MSTIGYLTLAISEVDPAILRAVFERLCRSSAEFEKAAAKRLLVADKREESEEADEPDEGAAARSARPRPRMMFGPGRGRGMSCARRVGRRMTC